MLIHDAHTRNVARVNSMGELFTRTTTFDAEEAAARDGDAFVIYSRCHLAAAASGAFLYFKNTSQTYNVYITRLYFDAHQLSKSLILTQWKNPTPSGGTLLTGSNEDGKINKHFSNPLQLEGEVTVSDGAADLSLAGGVEYHGFPLKSLESNQRNLIGTNVISPGKGIGWRWETADGAAATDGELVSLSINLYRSESGVHQHLT
jgi:hypothetical protein